MPAPLYKQQQENTKQLEAYTSYQQMGMGRSLRQLETELRARWGRGSPCLTTLERWSSRFNWQDRLQQWVVLEGGKADLAVQEARVSMQLSHMVAAEHALIIAMEVIRKSKASMSPSNAIQLLSVVDRMRTSLLGAAAHKIELSGPDGGPIEIRANVVAVDLSHFTVEQLDRFEQLIAETERNGTVSTPQLATQ